MSKSISGRAYLLPFIVGALERDGWKLSSKYDPSKSFDYDKAFDGLSIRIRIVELDDGFSISLASLAGIGIPASIRNYQQPRELKEDNDTIRQECL